jgi:hypothetical protein
VEKSADNLVVFGAVYFVLAGDRIKIGYSEFVSHRVRMLSWKEKADATLLGVIPASTRSRERHIQAKFARYALGHEWFQDVDPIRAFAAQFPPREPVVIKRAEP